MYIFKSVVIILFVVFLLSCSKEKNVRGEVWFTGMLSENSRVSIKFLRLGGKEVLLFDQAVESNSIPPVMFRFPFQEKWLNDGATYVIEAMVQSADGEALWSGRRVITPKNLEHIYSDHIIKLDKPERQDSTDPNLRLFGFKNSPVNKVLPGYMFQCDSIKFNLDVNVDKAIFTAYHKPHFALVESKAPSRALYRTAREGVAEYSDGDVTVIIGNGGSQLKYMLSRHSCQVSLPSDAWSKALEKKHQFIARGYAPNWELFSVRGGELKYVRIDEWAKNALWIGSIYIPFKTNVTFPAVFGKGELTLRLEQEECTDKETGRVLPFVVTLKFKDNLSQGCAFYDL